MQIWTPITSLDELPRPQTEESECLEYKREPWETAGDKGYNELARDVAQFANHLGGSIVVGAVEDGQDRISDYLPIDAPAVVAARINDVCHSALSPRPRVQTNVVYIAADHPVVVVNVWPHDGVVANKVKGNDRWEFYRRFGKGKKPIAFEEVERMWTDGRKGRVLMSRIPETDLGLLRVDAREGHGVHMLGPYTIVRMQDYFTLYLSRPGTAFNLPYECVKAVWPSTGGGWSISLDVDVYLDPGSQMRVKYVPRN